MLDELRDRMMAFLSKRQVCLISTGCSEGAWAMPARYRNRGLEVECLLPRWADVTYYLEQNPDVLLVVQDYHAAGLFWLQFQGTARPVAVPDWNGLLPERPSTVSPDDLYVVVHVTPKRIDLIDQTRGWGARETLDL